MPRHRRPIKGNPTASNSEYTGPLNNNVPYPDMHNQFKQMMQAMLDQQHQANENLTRLQAQVNENQARLQKQMAKNDEDHAREMT